MGEESEVIVMPKEEKNTCRSDLAPKRKPKQPNVPPPPNLAAVSRKGSVGEAMSKINPPLAAPPARPMPMPWRRMVQQQERSASSAPPPAVPLAPTASKSAPSTRQASDSEDYLYEQKSESADSTSVPHQSVRSDSSSKPREQKKNKTKAQRKGVR